MSQVRYVYHVFDYRDTGATLETHNRDKAAEYWLKGKLVHRRLERYYGQGRWRWEGRWEYFPLKRQEESR